MTWVIRQHPPSAAGPEPLHPDVRRRAAQLDEQAARELGERRRPADEGGRVRTSPAAAAPPAVSRPAGRSRLVGPGQRDRARRPRPARRGTAGRPGCARTRRAAAGPAGRVAAACRSIATNGTAPLPPATPTARRRRRPRRTSRRSGRAPRARRPARRRRPGTRTPRRPSSRSIHSSTSGSDGRGGDRVGPLRDVAVLGGQPDHVVLPGQVVDPVRDVQPQHHRPSVSGG